TAYGYDKAGRHITTTLPNGVLIINEYDDANRLIHLTYTTDDNILLANYIYQLDSIGNKRVVTETILSPEVTATIETFLEQNGLLVLEAEAGQVGTGSSHTWTGQTVQSGYGGEGYIRALPDIGALYEADELGDSPEATYAVQI